MLGFGGGGGAEETEDLGKKRSDLQFFAFFCMSLYTSMHGTMKCLGRRGRDLPPTKKVLYVEYSYIIYIFSVDGCTVV